MSKIEGAPEKVLERIQELVREIVPGANCEVQDYGHQIGCGAEDQRGNVRDVKFRRHEWDEDIVRHKAKALEAMVRTGGSTAG